jgi:alkylhydroperoxidase/carboxymuconolactone decarboxylase family protein YurZ
MSESLYPTVTRNLADARHALAPGVEDAFRAFSDKVFTEGALPAKTKQLIRDSSDSRLPRVDVASFCRIRQACEGSNQPRTPHSAAS